VGKGEEVVMTSRRSLPVATRRAVLAEAGYRCAVPTCRSIIALDLHHIEDLQEGGGDEVSNLIALCPTCHALYTRGTITRDAIQLWKRRLVALNHAGAKNVAHAYIVLRSDSVELQHAINVRSVKVAHVVHDVSHRPCVHVTWDTPFADAFYDVNIGSVEYILGGLFKHRAVHENGWRGGTRVCGFNRHACVAVGLSY
jgi:hypothetical protein